MLLSKPYKSIPPLRLSITQIMLISTSKTCMDLHENFEIRLPEKISATGNSQEKSKAYKCLRKTELQTWKDKEKENRILDTIHPPQKLCRRSFRTPSLHTTAKLRMQIDLSRRKKLARYLPFKTSSPNPKEKQQWNVDTSPTKCTKPWKETKKEM
jgi:hypothetical protein